MHITDALFELELQTHEKTTVFSNYTSLEEKAVIMVCGEDVCSE